MNAIKGASVMRVSSGVSRKASLRKLHGTNRNIISACTPRDWNRESTCGAQKLGVLEAPKDVGRYFESGEQKP